MMLYPSRPCVPLGRIVGHSQDGSVCQPALHDSQRQRLLKHAGTQCTVVLYGARHWQSLRTHLIFADDIVLVAKSPEELESMLSDIYLASKPVGIQHEPE